MRATAPGQSALLLLDVIGVLKKSRVPYAVIGAFAASFYGVVRASMDADAVIFLPKGSADLETWHLRFQDAGLKSTIRRGDAHDPIGAVLNLEDRFHNRVDLLLNIRGVTAAALPRAIETEFLRARISIIGLEDFIAMKIFAGSPQDLDDVAGVLKVSHGRIRLPLLTRLVDAYGTNAKRTLQSLWRANAS